MYLENSIQLFYVWEVLVVDLYACLKYDLTFGGGVENIVLRIIHLLFFIPP